MGETRLLLSAKVDARLAVRVDEFAQRFAPFIDGRSQAIRILLELAFAAIDQGILPNTLEGWQAVLRRESCAPKIVKTTGIR